MSYIENLEKQLFEMQDLKYRDFHSKLLPGIDRETIIGIRTPMLRKFTKEFAETLEAELFLKDLPHRYYEENNMHMMIISWIKDYEVCLKEVKKLLPYVNNWAIIYCGNPDISDPASQTTAFPDFLYRT